MSLHEGFGQTYRQGVKESCHKSKESAKMRIALIDIALSGHHLEYLVILYRAFTELGHEVIVLCPDPEKVRDAHGVSKPTWRGKKLSCRIALGSANRRHVRRQALDQWRHLSEVIRSIEQQWGNPGLLFFAYLDAFIGRYLTKWDVQSILPVSFSGLLFQPQDIRSLPHAWLRFGPLNPQRLLASNLCVGVGVLAQDAVPFLSKVIRKPVTYVPDVATSPKHIIDTTLKDTIRQRAQGRLTIGLWGSIGRRKGIGDFLSMVSLLPSDQYFFVVGGNIHEGENLNANERELLERGKTGNIENFLVKDQWLSDDEILSGIQACDLIAAAYQNWHFTSGIIGKAALMQVPLLVNEGHIMAKQVRSFHLGLVKNQYETISDFVLKNREAILDYRQSAEFLAGSNNYSITHSYESFKKSLDDLTNLWVFGRSLLSRG
jgi:hypothetical protein